MHEVSRQVGDPLVGDWANDPSGGYYDGTRTSDLMTAHIRTFHQVTGVVRWQSVLDKSYQVIGVLQADHAPASGLLPDFAVDAPTAAPRPAPSGWLEGTTDGRYAWNACRTPWRIATDFVLDGEARAQATARAMTVFFRAETGDQPENVRDGYRLDGTATGSSAELAFVAPLAVAAMVEAETGSNQAWLDALWDWVVAAPSGGYYNDSIRLLVLAVVSGNWWAP